jgi:hypothetical protein
MNGQPRSWAAAGWPSPARPIGRPPAAWSPCSSGWIASGQAGAFPIVQQAGAEPEQGAQGGNERAARGYLLAVVAPFLIPGEDHPAGDLGQHHVAEPLVDPLQQRRLALPSLVALLVERRIVVVLVFLDQVVQGDEG